jgi:hypothetical protein
VATEGERVYFTPTGATAAQILPLLQSAGFRDPRRIADALADPHAAWQYSHESITRYHGGLFNFETGRHQDVMEAIDRPLSGAEMAEARRVFGPGLNYGAIRIVEDPVMGAGDIARTLPGKIYFPPGASRSGGFTPWLIHELMHSWQYQHGISLGVTSATAFLCYAGVQTYAYGGDAGLTAATAAGRNLRSFNTEQMGDIAGDEYRRLLSGGNTAPFMPWARGSRGDVRSRGTGARRSVSEAR